MILEVFTRVFVDGDAFDPTIAFYVDLLSGKETLRFSYPDAGLELAAISSAKLSMLIIAGPPERRAPFETTRLTIQVDRPEPYADLLARPAADSWSRSRRRRWAARPASGMPTARSSNMSTTTPLMDEG